MKNPLEDKKPNYDKQQWSDLIDKWIFDEIDRFILKRHLLDGITLEVIAEEINLSTRQTVRRNKRAQTKFFKHI